MFALVFKRLHLRQVLQALCAMISIQEVVSLICVYLQIWNGNRNILFCIFWSLSKNMRYCPWNYPSVNISFCPPCYCKSLSWTSLSVSKNCPIVALHTWFDDWQSYFFKYFVLCSFLWKYIVKLKFKISYSIIYIALRSFFRDFDNYLFFILNYT